MPKTLLFFCISIYNFELIPFRKIYHALSPVLSHEIGSATPVMFVFSLLIFQIISFMVHFWSSRSRRKENCKAVCSCDLESQYADNVQDIVTWPALNCWLLYSAFVYLCPRYSLVLHWTSDILNAPLTTEQRSSKSPRPWKQYCYRTLNWHLRLSVCLSVCLWLNLELPVTLIFCSFFNCSPV